MSGRFPRFSGYMLGYRPKKYIYFIAFLFTPTAREPEITIENKLCHILEVFFLTLTPECDVTVTGYSSKFNRV